METLLPNYLKLSRPGEMTLSGLNRLIGKVDVALSLLLGGLHDVRQGKLPHLLTAKQELSKLLELPK